MVVFPCPEPEYIGVVRVVNDAAHRIRSIGVEHRVKSSPVVRGFPDMSRSHGNKPFAVILRIDREISNTARGECRTDAPPLQPRNEG